MDFLLDFLVDDVRDMGWTFFIVATSLLCYSTFFYIYVCLCVKSVMKYIRPAQL